VNKQELASNKRPPLRRGSRQRHHTSAAAEAFLSKCRRVRRSATRLERYCGFATHRLKKIFGFQALMHFSSYLMIAAMVLMGLQLAYAFYQLAVLFL
jgi:hypothetical protein